MSPEPTTLVLLASEQLWPNLHSLEHWGGGLRRVLIYNTPDKRSAEPARRLRQFCDWRFKTLDVVPGEGAATPEAVAGQLARWRAALPEGQWMVNATGGTKLMFDGAAAMRGREGVRVVYRELGPDSPWYELGRSADGVPTATPIVVPADVTDRIPVSVLVRTLWETDALSVTFGNPAEDLPIDKITHALIETGGEWRRAFEVAKITMGEHENAGSPFERYVAGALRAMGLKPENIARGVRQEGAGQYTQEIDVVANHGARVLVFDCKLRSVEDEGSVVEGITSQLRQAAQTARQLGGLSGEVVLLRPNRELTDTERSLAADLRVRVIDRNDRACFFQQLGAFVGCRELPDSLRRADELLAVPGNTVRAFPPSKGVRRLALAAGGSPVIDLERLAGDWGRDCPGQDWAVVRVRTTLHYLQFQNRTGRSRRVLEDAVRGQLRSFGTGVDVNVSATGDTLFALFDVEPENQREFRAFLSSRVGRSLLD